MQFSILILDRAAVLKFMIYPCEKEILEVKQLILENVLILKSYISTGIHTI